MFDELRKPINLDEGKKLIDNACSEILYDNHGNSDVLDRSFHLFNIVLSKIVAYKFYSPHLTISHPKDSNMIKFYQTMKTMYLS